MLPKGLKTSTWGSVLVAGVSLLLVPVERARAEEPKLVVVLPMRLGGEARLDRATRQATEAGIRTVDAGIRAMAGDRLSPLGFTVLTSETTLAVLGDNGIDPEKACEASCSLGAARELKARYFISSTLERSEGDLIAFVLMFASDDGRQLAVAKLEGKTFKDLRHQFEDGAQTFFSKVMIAAVPENRAVPEPAPPVPPPATRSALRYLAIRAGLSPLAGVLGIGVEAGLGPVGVALGSGTNVVSGGLSYPFAQWGAGHFYADGHAVLVAPFLHPTQVHGVSLGFTVGHDWRPVPWLSVKTGIGLTANTGDPDLGKYIPVVFDLAVGPVLFEATP